MKTLTLALVAVCGALLLAACASPQHSKEAQSAEQQNQKVCFRTTSLGSHIGGIHCMSKANYKEYKKAQAEQAKKERAKWRQREATSPRMTCPECSL